MANLPESETWEAGVYQLETTDPVQGGASGKSNEPLIDLANRTRWLRRQDLNKRGAGALAKQCIVTCKHTNGIVDILTGYPYAGGTNMTVVADATNPLVITFSGGYDSNGPLVKYAILDTTTTLAIPISGADKLIVATLTNDVCAITLENYFAPVYAYEAPSSPADGWYWYDLRHEVMYKRVSGAWVQTYAVILGYVSPGDEFADIYPAVGRSAMSLHGRGETPVGMIATYAVNAVPTGYLKCNGAAISRSAYRDLFNAIGTTYGAGDGSTTFNLPDLRGEFVRGYDDARGIDSGRSFGSAQTSTEISQHIGSFGTSLAIAIQNPDSTTAYSITEKITTSTGSTQSFSRYGVRPRNVALLYLIKY